MINSWKIALAGVLLAVPTLLAAAPGAASAPAASQPGSLPASAPARAATAAEITEWAKQLADESWKVREEAQARLIEAGEASLEAVQTLVASNDPEVKQRSQLIQAEIAKNAHAARAVAVLKNELWKAKLSEAMAARPSVGRGLVCIRTVSGAVTALSSLTGGVQWTFTPENKTAGDAACLRPVLIEGNTVLVTWPGGSLYALDIETGKPRWQLDREGGVTDPVVAGGLVLVCGLAKNIYALDLEKGQEQWAIEFDSTFSVAPVACGNYVVVAPEKGGLIGIDCKTGKRLWNVSSASATFGLSAVPDESVLWRTADTMTLCDIKTGTARWTMPAGPMVGGAGGAANARAMMLQAKMNGMAMGGVARGDEALAISDGVIYNSMGDQVFAIDANNGQRLWNFKPGGKEANAGNGNAAQGGAIVIRGNANIRIQAQIVVNGGNVVINGVSYGSGALSSPCVHEGMLYVGSAEGLHAVDLKTRLEVWKIEAKGVTVQPFVVGGVLYFATGKAESGVAMYNAPQPADENAPAEDYVLHAVKLKK